MVEVGSLARTNLGTRSRPDHSALAGPRRPRHVSADDPRMDADVHDQTKSDVTTATTGGGRAPGEAPAPARQPAEARPRPPLQAILFDLDGTLVATKRLYLEAYRRALATHLGHVPTPEEVVALRPSSELRFLQAVVGPELYDACLADFRRHYAELHETHFGGLYDGVEQMLAELRAAAIPIGIVTGKSRGSWDVTIANVELGPFDVTVFDDDVARPKPDPEGLLLALERLQVPPARAAYVGDGTQDASAAAAAGLLPVAALWPKKPEEIETFTRHVLLHGAVLARTPADVVALVRDPSRRPAPGP